MRVCMVVYDMQELGGLEEYAVTVAEGLHNLGHQVSVVSTAWVPPGNQYARRLAAARLPLVQLPKWLSLPASDWSTKEAVLDWCSLLLLPVILVLGIGRALATRKGLRQSLASARNWVRFHLMRRIVGPDWRKPLARLLFDWWRLRWRPSLLHIHGYTTNLLFVIEWAHSRGVPVVYEEHQTPDPQFNWWRGFQASVDKASVVVAVSGESARALREYCGISRPIVVIGRPLSDPVMAGWVCGDDRYTASAAPQVTTVARLYVTKGLEYLLEAATAVRAKHPAVQFRVFGDGPLREDLLALAKQLGLDGGMVFPGAFAGRDELARVLSETDIFVLPSVLEGQPMALVEAMAFGCPIVATAVGGIPELIEDGVNGLLCPSRNPASLAKTVCELVESPRLRRRLGKAAREAYERGPYQPVAVCQQLLSVYRQALNPAQ